VIHDKIPSARSLALVASLAPHSKARSDAP
jgi:hypothetical protein